LINSYPEASVFTYLQENQDGFAPVPGEDKVPSSMMTEDELSTWTKVPASRRRHQGPESRRKRNFIPTKVPVILTRSRPSRSNVISSPVDYQFDPFHVLPDEVVLLIIKKVVDEISAAASIFFDEYQKKTDQFFRQRGWFSSFLQPEQSLTDTGHTFIVDVIANVSARFHQLAKDKSLWQGRVNIKIGPANYPLVKKQQKLKMVIQNFLGTGVENLFLTTRHSRLSRSNPEPRPKLTAVDINAMAVKCPNIKKLHIRGFKMESLPALKNPWNLEHLILDLSEMVPRKFPFSDGEIHASLPNLRKIEMGRCKGPSSLPDMSKCKKLEEVSLYKCGVYPTVFPGSKMRCSTKQLDSFNETCACGFPRNLKKLYVYRCPFIYYDNDCYHDRLANCDVQIIDFLFEGDSTGENFWVDDVHLT